MILLVIQTKSWNDCQYDDWCPRLHKVRFRSKKEAQYVRLASEGRKWFCVLHLGQRGRSAAPRRAAITHVFHSEHVKRQTTSARLWHYLLSRAIFETQTRPHTCHVFHGVTFMTTESAQYMILEQKKTPNQIAAKCCLQKRRDETTSGCSQCWLKTAWCWC